MRTKKDCINRYNLFYAFNFPAFRNIRRYAESTA